MKAMLEDKVIQGLEYYSYDEVVDLVSDFIKDRLYENNIIPNKDIKIIEIQLHGSRLRGQAKRDLILMLYCNMKVIYGKMIYLQS